MDNFNQYSFNDRPTGPVESVIRSFFSWLWMMFKKDVTASLICVFSLIGFISQIVVIAHLEYPVWVLLVCGIMSILLCGGLAATAVMKRRAFGLMAIGGVAFIESLLLLCYYIATVARYYYYSDISFRIVPIIVIPVILTSAGTVLGCIFKKIRIAVICAVISTLPMLLITVVMISSAWRVPALQMLLALISMPVVYYLAIINFYRAWLKKEVNWNDGIRKQGVPMGIVLSIGTLGLYNIYWLTDIIRNVHHMHDEHSPIAAETVFVTVLPLYNVYWMYRNGKQVYHDSYKENGNLPDHAVAYMLLALFGFGFIAYAMLQYGFNHYQTLSAPVQTTEE